MSLMARPLFQPKIIHGIPGRLRVRVPSLQTSPDLKATLEAQMKATPAVETVRISHATDSIIINYRPQAEGMTQTQIYQLITQITQEFFAPNVNHQDREEMAVSETNGTYQERTVALAETANPVTENPTITQPKSLIPDPELEVIATELTDTKLIALTNEISSTKTTPESLIPNPEPELTDTKSVEPTNEISSAGTTETAPKSLIPDPEPAVITTELTDAKLTELTNDISSTTTTEINSKSLIPDPEPAVIATELTDAKLTEVTNDISSTSTTEITSESLIPDPEPAVIADEVSSTATTEITPERASPPPPTKPSRRTSPRKPRTRKKPEPPANS